MVNKDEESQFDTTRGWQRPLFPGCRRVLPLLHLSGLDPSAAALLDSHAGFLIQLSLAGFFLRASRYSCRSLPCTGRRHRDPSGDHIAACPRSGVLRVRGVPLERAAAHVCHEACLTFWCGTSMSPLPDNTTAASRSELSYCHGGEGSRLWSGPHGPPSCCLRLQAASSGVRADVLLGLVCAIDTGGRWCTQAAFSRMPRAPSVACSCCCWDSL